MNVLMTTDTVGGVWTYCMELCAALAPHGVHITLASMGRQLSAEQQRQVDALPHVRLHASNYKLLWMANSAADVVSAGEWLLELERETQPDIVHLNDLAHGGLAWKAPVLLVAHSCVYSWWQMVKNRQAPAEDWHGYKHTVTKSLRKANLVAAPSQAMLDAFLSNYGPANASLVLPNGADFPPLAASPLQSVTHKEPLIFAAGRLWDEAKNVAALTKAAPQLSWPVYVAGEQRPPGTDAQNTVLEGVTALGHLDRDDLAAWLARASIYVAPARYEPFGLGILEAARSGCALILGNIASLREVWGDAAAYVGADDPQQLGRAVMSLINSPGRLQHMAERAWAKAQEYSAAQMADAYMATYRDLQFPPKAKPSGLVRSAAGSSP